MVSLNAGMIMKHNHKRVVVLRTGLSLDGADAVMIAPLNTRRPSGKAPAVEANTWYDNYWIATDQAKVVEAAEVVHAFTGPGRVRRSTLNAVLKEL
ncbi:hypothetical protein [Amycolatopsis rifamycinica]|uniref:Uncharacterized protein n=1 Tax=Amycolatopsis rifamycinica TaxID=287986 RepID=A0A066TV61_9PSEU|nr:hypothetical protein [Amycolatopsis rifamycinica]KDN18715.1 hypothetical protein DV20_29425 [Amycolatopsis rifamycinica]